MTSSEQVRVRDHKRTRYVSFLASQSTGKQMVRKSPVNAITPLAARICFLVREVL